MMDVLKSSSDNTKRDNNFAHFHDFLENNVSGAFGDQGV
jgi:hypothetical protein